MTDTPQVRIISAAEWQIYKALRLRALADAPYAFGSTLAREEKRTDAAWKDRFIADESSWNLPVFAEVAQEPVGLSWGRIERANPEIANLYQMWVAPTHRGLGLGRLLLNTVIAWAKEKNAHYLDLGVTVQDNNPAIQLYTRAGFRPIGEPEALRPDSTLMGQSMRLDLRNQNAP